MKVSATGPDKGVVNQPARYKITVTNEGARQAPGNVLAEAQLADKVTFDSASEKVESLAGKVAWFAGTMEPNTTKTLDLVLKARQGQVVHHGAGSR